MDGEDDGRPVRVATPGADDTQRTALVEYLAARNPSGLALILVDLESAHHPAYRFLLDRMAVATGNIGPVVDRLRRDIGDLVGWYPGRATRRRNSTSTASANVWRCCSTPVMPIRFWNWAT